MRYYVPYFHWGSKFNAGFKAKMDVERILIRMGVQRIDIFKGKSRRDRKNFYASQTLVITFSLFG